VSRKHVVLQDHGLDKALVHTLIAKAKAALEKVEHVSFIQPVRTLNRTVGPLLSCTIAKQYADDCLLDDSIHILLTVTAAQRSLSSAAAAAQSRLDRIIR
ncbi:hypothetical protein, partial [Paraburkholderia ginsengiterrae]|uniref:hypothetical protein n=1 Tax=Paraburkholderia ginsengiterrae TaxID=1462993 RepID=UPI001FC95287